MSQPLREVWEHLVSHQVTRDLVGWLDCFAPDAVMEWPFRLNGVPACLEGRDAIRTAVEPVWERAKQTNRRILGHEHVVFHRPRTPRWPSWSSTSSAKQRGDLSVSRWSTCSAFEVAACSYSASWSIRPR
jgi:hypothetical protein